MEAIWIIIAILAAVAGSAMVANLLPFSIDKKLNPLVMFLAALTALALPHIIILALAMTIPMGLIYGWTGIRLQGHTPVKLPIEEAKALTKRIKIPKKAEVSVFLDKEFPNPEAVEKYVPEL